MKGKKGSFSVVELKSFSIARKISSKKLRKEEQ
jgi:hypothetical protein